MRQAQITASEGVKSGNPGGPKQLFPSGVAAQRCTSAVLLLPWNNHRWRSWRGTLSNTWFCLLGPGVHLGLTAGRKQMFLPHTCGFTGRLKPYMCVHSCPLTHMYLLLLKHLSVSVADLLVWLFPSFLPSECQQNVLPPVCLPQ